MAGIPWGNFISANGLDTGRFLDGPEFQVYHDHGNEENLFDRFDFKPSDTNTFSLNFQFTRSWFQTPNSYDAQTADAWSGPVCINYLSYSNACNGLGPNGQVGRPHGSAFQDPDIRCCTHLDPSSESEHRVHLRRLRAAGSIQLLSEQRSFRRPHPGPSAPDHRPEPPADESGARASVSYIKGIHNIKVGVDYSDTILTENDRFGIVDPTANAVCLNARRKSRHESDA